MTISVDKVTCSRDGHRVLTDVSFALTPGRVMALVGPNGAGKSTLLAVMCGDIPVESGSVTVNGRPLEAWKATELARERAVLLQRNEVSFAFTVREVVEMGRAPWTSVMDVDSDEDIITAALTTVDINHLADRPYRSLSGGEQARASLARVLAQQTPTVLLDEPTAALDLRHQEEVMRTARALAGHGRAVCVVVHDLSLAAAYADDVAVISDGTLTELGTPEDVLTEEVLARVYGIAVHRMTSPDGHAVIVPRRHCAPEHHRSNSTTTRKGS